MGPAVTADPGGVHGGSPRGDELPELPAAPRVARERWHPVPIAPEDGHARVYNWELEQDLAWFPIRVDGIEDQVVVTVSAWPDIDRRLVFALPFRRAWQ